MVTWFIVDNILHFTRIDHMVFKSRLRFYAPFLKEINRSETVSGHHR